MGKASELVSTVPSGITRVGHEDFAVWSVPWAVVEDAEDPVELAGTLDHAGVTAVAVDLEGLVAPRPARGEPVLPVGEELLDLEDARNTGLLTEREYQKHRKAIMDNKCTR